MAMALRGPTWGWTPPGLIIVRGGRRFSMYSVCKSSTNIFNHFIDDVSNVPKLMSLLSLMSPKPRPLVLIISKKTRDIRDKRDVSTPPISSLYGVSYLSIFMQLHHKSNITFQSNYSVGHCTTLAKNYMMSLYGKFGLQLQSRAFHLGSFSNPFFKFQLF